MLINFNDIVSKYGKPKGIIHIGAHMLEEREGYINAGLSNTIWIEGNPKIFEKINFVNGENSTEKVFSFLISEIDDEIVNFKITNNGQSSSILNLDKHKIYHPNIHVIETIKLKTKRMDSLIKEHSIDMTRYDFLNLDIQGVELQALKSFGDLLKNIKYIYTEVNVDSIYENCSLMSDIDEYLKLYNFNRVETQITEYKWGDALYIKK